MDPLIIPIITIVFAASTLVYIMRVVFREKVDRNTKMWKISNAIRIGTKAYLNRQLRVIFWFLPILTLIIFVFLNVETSISFVFGALLSVVSAYEVMRKIVKVNVLVSNDAKTSTLKAFRKAFLGGSIMGISVPLISLVGLGFLFFIFRNADSLVGFGFGASLTALFAQVGGGIFTKAADIGADIVGKIEMSIPEDDPRNPAVIADLVGDNVGDSAGRSSDLFQSFSGDIITGIIIGTAFISKYGTMAIMFPILLQCVGLLSSILGVFVVSVLKYSPSKNFGTGLLATTLACIVGSFMLSVFILKDITIFYAIVSGIIAVLISVYVAHYYTGFSGGPVKKMADASQRGAALNVITGLYYGLRSSFIPVMAVLGSAVFSYVISGGSLFAIVAANISTDLFIGFIMAANAFGPIVDNAGGIAEMAKERKAAKNIAILDAAGNSMKAYTKALSMSSATITTFVILITFLEISGVSQINIIQPYNIVAFFVGVSVPFLFSSFIIGSTAKTAMVMVDEVRRQFREIKGIMTGKASPDYERCIDISTKNALKEMVLPGLIAIIPPVIVGILFGVETLVSFLIGLTSSAVVLGVFFNNVGAIFDNTKKLVENGLYGGKGSETHKATVVGDTVGDSLKDVAGPSLIIFMKLVGMTALLILPLVSVA